MDLKKEVRLLKDLTGTEYKLYKLIEIKNGHIPTERFVYENLGMSRTTYYKVLKGLKDKGLL